ncbi:MAG: hypothetical protein AAGU07_03535 [Methanobacterium sp.]|jgi:predicted negative regulator of RcsB-dependent stress response
MIGDIHLKNESKKDAVANYSKALKLNPKVGVKRKYNCILNELDRG